MSNRIQFCTVVLSIQFFMASAIAEERSFSPPAGATPELYILDQPAGVVAGKQYPLIIFLHGAHGNHRRQWTDPELETFRRLAAERGYFALSPDLGRTHWMNPAADYVLNALLDHVLLQNPIHPARVYIMGMSMGGGAALTFAIHHPERIRAVCDIFGVTDFAWHYRNSPHRTSLREAYAVDPDTSPALYRWQSAMDNLDAFAHIPVFILHGDQDATVPVLHARRLAQALQEHGRKVVYHEVKDGTHTSKLIQGFEQEILSFFDAAGQIPSTIPAPTAMPATSAADRSPVGRLPCTILMVDDNDILYRSGTQRVLQPFQKSTENPLIKCDRPWEVAIAWNSIYRNPETGVYQLWYQAYSGEQAHAKTHQCVVCYAESKDGLRFTKPELDLFAFNEIKKTNIVLVGSGGHSLRYANSVVVDPRDDDPGRRYKMAYFDFATENHKEYPGLQVAFSPDGIHWARYPHAALLRSAYGNFGEPVPFDGEAGRDWSVPLSMADAADVFFDPRRNVFVDYGKMWVDGPDGGMFFKHGMGRTESRDFITWSPPQLILTPDDTDPPGLEFHTSPVFFHADRYFSLNQILNRAVGGGVIDIELMLSCDGLEWRRPFRNQYVLSRSAGQQFDSGSIFTNSTPVILNDEMRFYYGGYSQGATGSDDTKLTSGIGLATLPRDRFAGIKPLPRSDQPTLPKPLENVGQVTLRPMSLGSVRSMALNADANGGEIRVEVLNERGYRVQGFSREDATPIHSDSLHCPVTWNTRTLADLPPGNYMFRFHLRSATLFSVTLGN